MIPVAFKNYFLFSYCGLINYGFSVNFNKPVEYFFALPSRLLNNNHYLNKPKEKRFGVRDAKNEYLIETSVLSFTINIQSKFQKVIKNYLFRLNYYSNTCPCIAKLQTDWLVNTK